MISLGQQSQLGIGIAISLQNNFSGSALKVLQQMNQMKNAANQMVLGAMRNYRNMSAGIATAAGAATLGMYKMAESGAEFQHKINQVAIVGGRELGKTRKQLTDFSLQMDKTFTRNPTEIAGAMFENVKAGITTGLQLITKYQIAVATATDEILEGENGVAFGLNSIMNAMNLTYKDFPRIANAVTAAANASQASVIGLNESMQYFANTAHLSNMGLEETLALLAKLSQSGIRGSAAGTAAANMLNYLEKTVGPFRGKKATKAWEMLGINPDALAPFINRGQITDVLSFISSKAQNLPTVQRKSALNALFNIRGERALENMFIDADPTKSFSALKQQIFSGEKTDIAMKQSKAMMNDLQGEIGLFKNQLTNFRIAFTEAVGPTLRVIISFGSKLLSLTTSILKTPIGKILAGVAAVTIPLIGILFAFRAAALTATIALNGFAGMAARGTFSNLMGAGMDMFSGGFLKGKGVGLNSLGKSYVLKGQQVNYMGKIYKGGQFLPKGFQAGGWGSKIGNFLGFGSMAGAGGFGGKIIGFLGKMAPWLGKIAGFAFRWLPVIGWIWSIYEVLDAIFDLWGTKKQRDPVRQKYDQEMYNQSMSKLWPRDQRQTPYDSWVAAHGGKDQILQTINVNLDGKQVYTKQINQQLQRDLNNQFNVNTIH